MKGVHSYIGSHLLNPQLLPFDKMYVFFRENTTDHHFCFWMIILSVCNLFLITTNTIKLPIVVNCLFAASTKLIVQWRIFVRSLLGLSKCCMLQPFGFFFCRCLQNSLFSKENVCLTGISCVVVDKFKKLPSVLIIRITVFFLDEKKNNTYHCQLFFLSCTQFKRKKGNTFSPVFINLYELYSQSWNRGDTIRRTLQELCIFVDIGSDFYKYAQWLNSFIVTL